MWGRRIVIPTPDHLTAESSVVGQLLPFISTSLNAFRFVQPLPVTASCNQSLHSWFQTFAVFWIYYVFFWVFPGRLNYIFRRFGILYLLHLHRQMVSPAYEDGTDKVFRNVGIYNSDAGEIPKRKHNTIYVYLFSWQQKTAYLEIMAFSGTIVSRIMAEWIKNIGGAIIDKEKTEIFEKETVPISLHETHIAHELFWDSTRTFAAISL